MILDGFCLEILVKGRPLPEIAQPITTLDVPTTTGPSFIFEERNKEWKIRQIVIFFLLKLLQPIFVIDSFIWAEVPHAGVQFSIRFSSTKATPHDPIMAFIVVDGQLDYRYIELYNSGAYLRDHFVSAYRDFRYYFKFDKTMWSDECHKVYSDSSQPISYGGIGAISVYFYRATPVFELVGEIPNFQLHQKILPERKTMASIGLSTTFQPMWVPDNMMPNVNFLRPRSNSPIAVLHLHYRPASSVILSSGIVQPEVKVKQEVIEERNLFSEGSSSEIEPSPVEQASSLKKSDNKSPTLKVGLHNDMQEHFIEGYIKLEENAQKFLVNGKIEVSNYGGLASISSLINDYANDTISSLDFNQAETQETETTFNGEKVGKIKFEVSNSSTPKVNRKRERPKSNKSRHLRGNGNLRQQKHKHSRFHHRSLLRF
ncbi:10802_t:CDS:2 [Cetraspora pellucida]|uniref:10802_t:CDS:1 n=1 Tax=Cetraspora pellucida TaxID=1433469 RepID=A0A9N8YW72_9GLOM|nr:10802_t:CDS:2 [Cetraspora pellucida]